MSFFSGPMRKQWLGRSSADRAAAIRDLALYAKRFAGSPPFEKMYDGWIQSHFGAVNHGMKLDGAPAATSTEVEQMQSAAVGGGDEKKWLGGAKQIEPLLKSNPAEFKKQYILLKSASMGGPSTEAGLATANAKGAGMAADAKKREEQQKYNEHRLRVVLKKRLADFVQLARGVDFAAQTKTVNGRQVFVNAAYEQKSETWKKVYRLGKEPTFAALGSPSSG